MFVTSVLILAHMTIVDNYNKTCGFFTENVSKLKIVGGGGGQHFMKYLNYCFYLTFSC